MQDQAEYPWIDRLGPIRQLGHVVEDIPASMAEWERQGVGPWLWMRNVRLNCSYRGKPSRPVIDVALSYQGEMQIELIQPINAAPSPYRQTVEQGNYGLHHHAWLCRNIQQSVELLEQQGLQMVCDIRMFGSRYVYMQDADGRYVELLPASLMMRSMFSRGIAASKQWQGRGAPLVLNLKNPFALLASLPAAAAARLKSLNP